MIGKTNATSGSGGTSSGGTLTVYAPVTSVVTVSKDTVSMSKTVTGNDVTFTGLTSGAWTINTVKGSQSDSRVINITLDYDQTVTFFTSFINVTYPAGSACSATDGNITLTAPDTSGSWKCEVPNAGTWTVTSSKSGLNATGSVTITETGESKSITLTYVKSIYTAGQTSGFAAYALPKTADDYSETPTISYGSTSFTASVGTAYRSGCVMTSEKIDLSAYSTLTVNGSSGGGGASTVCIWSNRGSTWSSNIVASKDLTGPLTFDVSGLSGSYYIGFGFMNGSSSRNITLTDMHLS